MGLLVSRQSSRFVSLLSSFGTFLKTAIIATIADCYFSCVLRSRTKSKLHRRAVRLALFPKPLTNFERRKSNHQLGRISRKYRLLPCKVEKIRIDASNELPG